MFTARINVAFRLPLVQKTNSIKFKRASVSWTEIRALGEKETKTRRATTRKQMMHRLKTSGATNGESRKTKWGLTMAPTLYVAAGASAWL